MADPFLKNGNLLWQFYFVKSQGREGVVRESAAHASNQLCSSCVEESTLLPLPFAIVNSHAVLLLIFYLFLFTTIRRHVIKLTNVKKR